MFAGEDSNLYGYVLNDPVNLLDAVGTGGLPVDLGPVKAAGRLNDQARTELSNSLETGLTNTLRKIIDVARNRLGPQKPTTTKEGPPQNDKGPKNKGKKKKTKCRPRRRPSNPTPQPANPESTSSTPAPPPSPWEVEVYLGSELQVVAVPPF